MALDNNNSARLSEGRDTTPEPRDELAQDNPSALYLLNCYDVWSATPAPDTGFDCACVGLAA